MTLAIITDFYTFQNPPEGQKRAKSPRPHRQAYYLSFIDGEHVRKWYSSHLLRFLEEFIFFLLGGIAGATVIQKKPAAWTSEKENRAMKGYRPSYFDEGETPGDLLQQDRARRIPAYMEKASKGQPLFEQPAAPEASRLPSGAAVGTCIRPSKRAYPRMPRRPFR